MSAQKILGQVAPLEIGLTVRDLEGSLAFWRDALGLAEISRIDNPVDTACSSGIASGAYTVVRLQLPGGERLKLFEPVAPAGAAHPGERPLSTVGLAFITLIVDDIAGVIDDMAARSFEARLPDPVELRPGVFVALVDDPDGNVVELVQYVDLAVYRPELALHRARIAVGPA